MGANLRLSIILLIFLFYHCRSVSISNITYGPVTIWLYTSNIIRITRLPPTIIAKPTLTSSRIVIYEPNTVPYTRNDNVITTNDLMIKIDSTDNYKVSFYDINNNETLLSESYSMFINITDPVWKKDPYLDRHDNNTRIIQQEWSFNDNDNDTNTALYGWGSYQNGFINFRDATIRCTQFNTEACIPFLISNKYYGILWDQYSISTLNYNTHIIIPETITEDTIWKNITFRYTATNLHNGYHSFFFNISEPCKYGKQPDACTYWLAEYKKEYHIEYNILIEYGPVVEVPSSMSLPPLFLQANETIEMKISFANCSHNQTKGQIPQIEIRGITNKFDIYTYEADYIDYYFIYSPIAKINNNLDNVINNYRLLTGTAPLFELKAYGFWQCQQRYHNQSEILQSAALFRKLHIPVDNIVQDWDYWGSSTNQGPIWDTKYYPYPSQMVDQLHAMNFNLMVSVWSKFGTSTQMYKQMSRDNELIPDTPFVDVWSLNASKQFYEYSKKGMFDIGVDALWLDDTEPAEYPQQNKPIDPYGRHFNKDREHESGNMLLNTFSLYVTKAIADGLSTDYPNKRVFTLTRSSYTHQQYMSAVIWTGDTLSTWNCLHRQIVSSINYQLSGIPYWTQDIGGFIRPDNSYNNTQYQRLLIRWFQFGVFTPIFRTHGNNVNTGIWYYGNMVYKYVLQMFNLRYRLLPYIYSLAFMIEQVGYTIQRGLILEFTNDEQVMYINDQFMFGPNILVAPIYNDNNMRDEIYLPRKLNTYLYYYDFWNGTKIIAGKWYYNQVFDLNIIPLYIPSGSILLLAPYLQYSNQLPWTPIEVRIYKGNDAEFVLFEDDFVSKNSRINKQYSKINFTWNDNANQLTINRRNGSYVGMLQERYFYIVLVRENHGIGVNVSRNVDKIVAYNGTKVVVNC